MSLLMKIAATKTLEVNSNVNFVGTVLDTSCIQEGKNNFKSKFYCIVADETGSTSVTVYNENLKDKFQKEKGVVILNALLKDNFIAVTSRTEVGVTKPIVILESIKRGAPQLMPHQTPVKEMNIVEALESPEKTMASVKGKIVKVLPADTRTSNNKVLPYQELVIKDATGSSRIALWDEMVNQFSAGQLVKFSKCKVKLFAQKKRLTTVSGGNYELVNEDEDLKDISDEEDVSDDVLDTLVSGTIIAIFECDPYLACPQKSCANKKPTTIKEHKYLMLCPTCNGKFSASNCSWYARVTVLFDHKKLCIFKPELQKIFAAKNLPTEVGLDKEELFIKLSSLIPIDIKCLIVNSTIRNLTCKRMAENN